MSISFRQKGEPYILLTGVGLIFSLVMVFYIVLLILVKGLGFFWATDMAEVSMKNGEVYLGEIMARETSYLTDANGKETAIEQIQMKIANRDVYGRDFIWLKVPEIDKQTRPENAAHIERMEYGAFYGYFRKLHNGDGVIESDAPDFLPRTREAHGLAWQNKDHIGELEEALNDLSAPLTKLQREISLMQISGETVTETGAQKLASLKEKADVLQQEIAPRYQELEQRLQALYRENQNIFMEVATADGQSKSIGLGNIVRFYQPNRLSIWQKSGIYAAKLWEFVAADPRESNTEGGVFPAIFGTVMMVLIMSIAVVPFGVLAAIYLNEYARQGAVVRLIRLSVNNLAGVPSIVYGIFGLGFLIYMVGGSIDQLFFSSKLPEPTFGTGGILWASLTLALLTLPVVVVATEEGILAVPRANKEGALALGSTRWQMIRKIVLPNAMPGILTGLILAISRGAGEVAPLMITGVVKLAPSLPIDGTFPFLHLDRKFMHLGFHIYDVGFQSPNVEAAKPMVYTTALLLILIVVVLNLLAIYLRNRLRKKFKSSVF